MNCFWKEMPEGDDNERVRGGEVCGGKRRTED
jgi:hypothetical protein